MEKIYMQNKIYGFIPIGGKGERLGLPYPKELLPQKNCSTYRPIINLTIDKMLDAGVSKIVFLHGQEYKKEFVNLFNDDKVFTHVKQINSGPINILKDFYNIVKPEDNDKILFGFADSLYNGNIYKEMLKINGLVCGLFNGNDEAKLDRLDKSLKNFDFKSLKNDNNSNWFWGLLKFDGKNLYDISIMNTDKFKDIGHILNNYEEKSFVYGENYIDIGTWAGYNYYLETFKLKPYNYSTAHRH
jgi:hypothetical protein